MMKKMGRHGIHSANAVPNICQMAPVSVERTAPNSTPACESTLGHRSIFLRELQHTGFVTCKVRRDLRDHVLMPLLLSYYHLRFVH